MLKDFLIKKVKIIYTGMDIKIQTVIVLLAWLELKTIEHFGNL